MADRGHEPLVPERAEEDRPDAGDTDRARELLHRVQNARRGSDLVVGDRRQDEVEQRRDDHPDPDSDEQLGCHHRERGRVEAVGKDHVPEPPHADSGEDGGDLKRGATDPRCDHSGTEHRAHCRAGGERRERQAGVDRREVHAELHEQREHEHRAEHPGEEHDDHRDPGPVGATAEDARLDQRVAAAATNAPGPGDERRERERARRDHQIRPRGPAGLATLDQRIDQEAHAEGGESGANQIKPWRRRRPGLGNQSRCAERRDQAERQVDEEDHPPPAPE